MDSKREKYSIVTGASQGLGEAISEELASRGKNLVLVALPGEELESLADVLSERYNIHVEYYETDFSMSHSVYEFASWVNDRFQVETLVNNVGIGGQISFAQSTAEYLDAVIQINIRTVSLLTRLLLDNMKRLDRSYILNVASMASFSPIPHKAIYPASKAFVYFLSRTLQEELKDSNIFVSVVHPGPMMTNARVSQDIIRQGWVARLGLISTRRIARISVKKLYGHCPFIIPGFSNKLTWLMMKLLPVRLHLYLGSALTKKQIEPANLTSGL
ncbi:MAG TPA: SDR family NAD(P)-dependent oxidoreductase [Bacteroidales bacterium]|nr:SDR family NAD(P)-dependent oxidoreductase [Bacteroidales bacterium]